MLPTVFSMIESASKVKCNIGKLMVGCKDRSVADSSESIAIYDLKKKAIVNSQEGTEKSDAKLKKYLDEIVKKVSK